MNSAQSQLLPHGTHSHAWKFLELMPGELQELISLGNCSGQNSPGGRNRQANTFGVCAEQKEQTRRKEGRNRLFHGGMCVPPLKRDFLLSSLLNTSCLERLGDFLLLQTGIPSIRQEQDRCGLGTSSLLSSVSCMCVGASRQARQGGQPLGKGMEQTLL